MSRFTQTLTEDLRLTILNLLQQAKGYDLNIHIIRSALADFGHRPSLDKLQAELAWLQEQGLVSLHEIGSITVATLTPRGEDVGAGRALIPGVKRPHPHDGQA